MMVLLSSFLAGLPTSPAMATEEPTPDTWYVETVILDDAALPADFHIFNGEPNPEQAGEGVWLTTNNPADSPHAAIYLINHSRLPVYVMSLEYRNRLVMATPDENYAARVRMAHEAASYLIRPGSGEVFELNWEALMDLDASLTDPNPPTQQMPPVDITPPAAQHSELLLVYGEQVVLLPFSITYTLNPTFESGPGAPTGAPETTAAPAGESNSSPGTKTILAAAGLGLAVLITWLVWRWRQPR